MTDNPFADGFIEPEPQPESERVEVATRQTVILEPGIYPDMTPDQYFAEPCPEPALSNSGIGDLTDKCAALFEFNHPALGQGPAERKSTAAQYRGQLVHRLALGKGADFAISPYAEYRTDEAKAWKSNCETKGIIPVKEKEFEEAEIVAQAFQRRIAEVLEGAEYQTEVVIAWQEPVEGQGLIWCRAMLDVWCPSRLVALDIKNYADLSNDKLDRAFSEGLGRQDAWYRRGLANLTGEHGRINFGFLFIEPKPPHLYRYAEASEHLRFGSEGECLRAIRLFDQCLKAGEWPGYEDHRAYPTAWRSQKWEAAELKEIS